MKELFLDANAHVPLSEKAIKSFSEFNSSKASHGHPSSLSLPGREAAAKLEESRSKIARLIGAKNSSQIIFTSTCTHACTWGLRILNNIDGLSNYDFYLSQTEHPAVSDSANIIFSKIKDIDTNKNGVIRPIYTNTRSKAACVYMQNEIGIIQPLEILNSEYIFSDMSQALGKIPINISNMNVDVAAFAGHKFGGMMVGFIYLKNPNNWISFDYGSRYYMDRSGTPDVGGIVATASALKHALDTLPLRTENMVLFRDVLESGLENLDFEIIAKSENRSPNTTFAKMPKDKNAADLLLSLSSKNIHIGLGSACGSIHTGGSPLMNKLGRPSNGQDYIRISQFGEYNDKDAKYLVDKIKAVI